MGGKKYITKIGIVYIGQYLSLMGMVLYAVSCIHDYTKLYYVYTHFISMHVHGISCIFKCIHYNTSTKYKLLGKQDRAR